MSFLLDTNAWKSLAVGARISAEAKVLTLPETALFLLDLSLWEICKAVECGNLELDQPVLTWMKTALRPNITVLSITPEIADLSCQLACLGLETRDPADQLICAAAKLMRFTLVTRDEKIIRWGKISLLEY